MVPEWCRGGKGVQTAILNIANAYVARAFGASAQSGEGSKRERGSHYAGIGIVCEVIAHGVASEDAAWNGRTRG